MFLKKRPTVTEFVDDFAFDINDQYAMNQDSFMIAVAADNYLDGPKSDPRFVKWVATLQSSTDDSLKVVHYPMHRCTIEELAKFYPTEKSA